MSKRDRQNDLAAMGGAGRDQIGANGRDADRDRVSANDRGAGRDERVS
jgi:hypothetical protein